MKQCDIFIQVNTIFETFDELIDCYVFANRIEYVELEEVILDMIDPMKINKDDDMNKNIKKLLDVKSVNEKVIYKKITMLLRKDEYIEDDKKLQELLDLINNVCYGHNGAIESISFGLPYACKFIEEKYI